MEITYKKLVTRCHPERIEEEEVTEDWTKLTEFNFCPKCGDNETYIGPDNTYEDNCGNVIICIGCGYTYCNGGASVYPYENETIILLAIKSKLVIENEC